MGGEDAAKDPFPFLLPAQPGKVHLVVSTYGAFVGKKSERLVVRERGRGGRSEVVREVPFFKLEQLTVASNGVSISSDVISACVEEGIPITFLRGSGRPYAKVMSPTLLGTVAIKREQFAAYQDGRGVELARAFAEGKIRNQMNVLRYFGRHRKRARPEDYALLEKACGALEEVCAQLGRVEGTKVEDVRGELLSLEGRASNVYWEAVGELVSGKVEFPGREHRGADDPLNAMLNYGYGVLYSEAWGAILLAGLEPFAGFIHADRSGKPSLVLDFVEEFRQPVVDRPLLAMVAKGFVPRLEDGKLSVEDRRRVAGAVLARLSGTERYEGKRHRIKTIIHLQARRIAGFLRGEGRYRPFVASW